MIFFPNLDNKCFCYCKGNYAVYVKVIMSEYLGSGHGVVCPLCINILFNSKYYFLEYLTSVLINDIIYLTLIMSKKEVVKTKNKNDPKTKSLSGQGVLNPHPERVKDPLFRENEFFDPRDLVQVKYEMIRKVTTDGKPVAQAAQEFGFSRPSFYQAQSAFEKEGLPGLIPRKRGPRTRHKLTEEIMKSIEKVRAENASTGLKDLVKHVQAHFGIRVHQRSIERAIGDKKKR